MYTRPPTHGTNDRCSNNGGDGDDDLYGDVRERELPTRQEMRVHIESKIIASLAPDYDKLPPLHKLEVFQRSMSQTDGQVC